MTAQPLCMVQIRSYNAYVQNHTEGWMQTAVTAGFRHEVSARDQVLAVLMIERLRSGQLGAWLGGAHVQGEPSQGPELSTANGLGRGNGKLRGVAHRERWVERLPFDLLTDRSVAEQNVHVWEGHEPTVRTTEAKAS
jgi:hypothetical protein